MAGIWGDGPRSGAFGARVDLALLRELEQRARERRSYETSLSPMEERQFRDWKQRFAPRDSGEDYDLRGAFKAGFQPDPETGHWPDVYKKPNHPTFSDQSIYAKDRPELAGSWNGDTYVPAGQRRIAGAFEAAEGMQEPTEALYEAKHRRAQGLPPPTTFLEDLASLGSRAVGGAQKMWQMAPGALEALVADPLGTVDRAGRAGQAATDAIVRAVPQPFARFNDPRFDQIENAADLTGAVMMGSAAIPAEANALRMGIKAYHASPHKFERFESRPGTGEGSNMFGPGTYLAENSAVSGRGGAYDRVFTRRNLGQQDTTPQQEYILNRLGEGASDLDILRGLAERGSTDFDQAQAMLDKVKANKANIYEVDVDVDPENLFNLDKPISEQPKLLQAIEQKWGDPEIVLQQLGLDPKTALGADYFSAMSGLGEVNKAGASAAVRDAGYGGLSFLDQGSRGAGTGTRNYVVFPGNEDLIKIDRVYSGGKGGAKVGAVLQGAKASREPKIFSPYSKIGQDIPVTETAPIHVPGSGPKLIEKTFDPTTLKPGDRLVGFIGDRTYTGEDLGGVRIGDKETIFKKPVKSEGGAGYMSHEFNPQDAYWASNQNPIAAYGNQLGAHQEAAAKVGGDVYAVTQAMSPMGGDFSMQATRTALEMLRRQPLTAKARESLYAAIDEAMVAPWGKKKEFPGIPDWPGMKVVMGKGGDRYLQGIGTGRAKLVKKLDTDFLRKLGAPNIGAARYAITDPRQRNASPLESGYGWFKLGEKTQRLPPEEVLRGHDTYPWVVMSPNGEYVGTRPMPVEVLFPGLVRRTRGMNASGQQKTATTSDVFEILTPQKLDRVMQWLASPEGQKLGVAGAVGAGLLTAVEAQQLFGDETAPPEA